MAVWSSDNTSKANNTDVLTDGDWNTRGKCVCTTAGKAATFYIDMGAVQTVDCLQFSADEIGVYVVDAEGNPTVDRRFAVQLYKGDTIDT